ncbi:hypothetical protein [Duganella vulcania]|uniref:Uncharacterized protein n=1 Tax=Duganella vulcania TaxID=2692166 RepID=A0A845GHS6_9BURK|nr:hypothetical protein [Duganella vulcania]MYM93060.1 hypothetical protein [Duganella vulcania]
MTETTTSTLIISSAIILAIAIVVIILRGKIRSASIKAGKISGKIETHLPEKTTLKDLVQETSHGSNEIDAKSSSATLENIKQKSKKNNSINIG